jgi:hypothetical protein
VNPNGSNVTAQLSITSTARAAAVLPELPGFASPRAWSTAWPTAGAILASLSLLLLPLTPKRVRRRIAFACVGLALLSICVGCAGASNTVSSGGGGGTPAGSYTLTITGTSGTQSRAATVTLVVK